MGELPNNLCNDCKKKFECNKCGECCKKFSNKDSKTKGLPIWEWEKEELENIAKEKGIKVNFEPCDLFFDKKSGLYLCPFYSIKQEPCPFLSSNKCVIYEKRPLVCKCFPLSKNPLIEKDKIFNLSSFLHCPNFSAKNFLEESFSLKEGEPYNIKGDKLIKEFLRVFGEEIFINSAIVSMLKEFYNNTLDGLIRDKKIKLRKVSKMDYDRHTATPFFEFLRKIGLCDENGRKVMINEIIDYKTIKEQILDTNKVIP